MASTTPNMSLVKWDLATDTFNYVDLAENFAKIDVHDHTSGRGKQIPRGGIAAKAIGASQIDDNAIDETKIQTDAVTKIKIRNGAVDINKLDKNSVNNDKIVNGSINGGQKIAPASITKDRLVTTLNTTGTTKTLYVNGQDSNYTSITSLLNAVAPGYTPSNGDEIYYRAGNTQDDLTETPTLFNRYAVWHLRYDSSLSSSYPWVFVGGSSFHSASTTDADSAEWGADSTTSWHYSALTKIVMPWAITGGIFDVTFSADVRGRNINSWSPGYEATTNPNRTEANRLRDDLNTNLRQSEVGAWISFGWFRQSSPSSNALIQATEDRAAVMDEMLAYANIANNTSYKREPAITLTKTSRVEVPTNASRSIVKFAQRNSNDTQTGTVSYNNRTLRITPIAIK